MDLLTNPAFVVVTAVPLLVAIGCFCWVLVQADRKAGRPPRYTRSLLVGVGIVLLLAGGRFLALQFLGG